MVVVVWLRAVSGSAQAVAPIAASPSTPFTFVAWGDSRGGTPGAVNSLVLSTLSIQAQGLIPAPSFTVFAGDLCNSLTSTCASSSTSGWTYALNGGSANNGTSRITFPFRGNHDSDAALWDRYFVGRDAVVAAIGGTDFNYYLTDGPERTYSFDYANSHIVGIDLPGGDVSTMTSGQIDWLDSDIAAAEARGVTHTFILDHGPIYYVDGHSSEPPTRLINVINKHWSISATFHGHEHVMAYVHADSTHIPGVTHPWEEFVAGAAGAPLYSCNTSRLIGAMDYCSGEANGFMSVEVDGNTFTVSLYLEGEPVAAKTWTFTKSPTPPRFSIDIDLGAGGATEAHTVESNEATQAGYAKVAMESGAVPYGTAVFRHKQNGITMSEAGVPASPPTKHARLFIDYRSGAPGAPGRGDAGKIDIDTGIAIVNCGSETADIIFTLRDIKGTRISRGQGILAAGAHFAKFVDQLKEVASDFDLPPDFPISTGFGSLEIESDQPFSVVALRETINQRHESFITTTPVADLTQTPATGPVYFPQFVEGGGYTSALVLLNTSGAVEKGTLQIFDDNGLPLVVNQVGGTSDSSFRYSIPWAGVFRFQTDGFPASVKAGWVVLTPDAGTSTPVGAGVFSYGIGNVLVGESGIPSAVATTHARVYVDLSSGHNTGLAIANPASANASITIRAYKADGLTPIGTSQGPLRLPGNGHTAKFATELISGLPAGFAGVLDIESATRFSALTLRSLNNERNDFLMTTFPVADTDLAAPSPAVFPQIADGGGFMTEFVLLSAGGASKTTLSFFDNAGRPLPVGK